MNEAKRIIKQIELNKLQVFINKVDVQTLDEFVECLKNVSGSCPNTVVMLLAAPTPTTQTTKKPKNIEEIDTPPYPKLMYVATSIPSEKNSAQGLIPLSIESIMNPDVKTLQTEGVYLNESQTYILHNVIEFPQTGEYFPFKLIDVVMGNAFGVLRKVGLYKDDSDDEEYGLELGD
jgi:hypothetical protein